MESFIPDPPAPLDADLFCGGCGQNLRGVAADRCPECGRRFDRARLISSEVPWEVRRHVGRVRAFFGTVWLVTRRPGRLVAGDATLTLRAARRFRAVVVLVLFLCSVGPGLVWYRAQPSRPVGVYSITVGRGDLLPLDHLLATRWFFFTTAVAWLLSLIAITGAGSLFFAPRRLGPEGQRRGVAASLYAGALLLWAIPIVPLLLVTHRSEHWMTFWLSQSLPLMLGFYLAMCVLIGWLMTSWLVSCRLLYAVTRSVTRVAIYATVWPVICAVTPVAIWWSLIALESYVAVVWARW